MINDTNKLLLTLIHDNYLQKESEVLMKFSSISGILKILMRQYTLIVQVYFGEKENLEAILSDFSDLLPLYIIPLTCKEEICMKTTEIVSEYILNNLLFELFLTCQRLYKNTLKADNTIYFNNIQILVLFY